MTDHGDDGDDDPQLGGLRAMWLSMPDEDPPSRGLAELMAAARVKAEEMAQPSLWQRIVAMMRRPPVLALATVVVLVAGAVLVGNRKDKFDDVAPVADQTIVAPEGTEMKPEPAAAATPAPMQAPAAPGTGSTAVEATGSPDPAALANEQEGVSPPRAKERVAIEKHANKAAPAPARKAKAEKAGGEEMLLDEGRGAVSTDGFAKGEDTRPEAKKTARRKTDSSGEKLLIAEPTAPPEDPQVRVGGASPPPPRETTAAPASEALATSDSSAGKAQQQVVGAAQLHAQARTAASRNDCAAAKVIAQRIAKQDPAYYRANVTKDAALGKCIGTVAQ
ncbi:MAG: hypothetical protein HOV81_45260 [Kofleriaceae bacterium]|nr:hypothetical protein [Kofleriaceae bacterium]